MIFTMVSRCALVACLLTASQATASGDEVLSVNEAVLPRYQATTFDRDMPAVDLELHGNVLFVAGKKSLWAWNINGRTLKRFRLARDKSETLSQIDSDGVNLYLASARSLYEVNLDPLKILRYETPVTEGGTSIGFGGKQDQMWWIHTKALIRIDRYGKTLLPRYTKTGLAAGDIAVLDEIRNIIWTTDGRKVRRVDLQQEKDRSEQVFETQHKIEALTVYDGGIIGHTSSVAFRLDGEGNLVQSIPVTNGRKLLAMDIDGTTHNYLFDDGLLESFDVKARTATRYQVPLSEASAKPVGKIRFQLRGKLLGLIENGAVRAFHLAAPVTK